MLWVLFVVDFYFVNVGGFLVGLMFSLVVVDKFISGYLVGLMFVVGIGMIVVDGKVG